jgi:glycosyltransferase involved in cell wall biosynthesis
LNAADTGRLRVAILTSEISPYRAPLFERLARTPGTRLKVFVGKERTYDRLWRTGKARGYEHQILKSTPVGRRLGFCYTVVLEDVGKALHRFGPDAVICGGWESSAALAALAFCRRHSTPFVLWNGRNEREDRCLRSAAANWIHDFSRALARFIVKRTDAHIAYSSAARDYVVGLGACPHRVFLAFNAVDNDLFRREYRKHLPNRHVIRRRLSLAPGEAVILYVGYFRRAKGVQELLHAFRDVCGGGQRVRLLLVGDGPQRDELVGLARELGIASKVGFVGYVQQEALGPFYTAADVFVLPTYVEPGNVARLAEAIGRFAADREFTTRAGQAGSRIVMKASLENAARAFAQAISCALAAKGRPSRRKKRRGSRQ